LTKAPSQGGVSSSHPSCDKRLTKQIGGVSCRRQSSKADLPGKIAFVGYGPGTGRRSVINRASNMPGSGNRPRICPPAAPPSQVNRS